MSEADWYTRSRSWWDVLRCVLGLHTPALNAHIGGRLIQRCTCGAFGPRPWIYLSRSEAREKWKRRSGHPDAAMTDSAQAVARAARRAAQVPDDELQAEIQRVGGELKARIAEIRHGWRAEP